MNTNNDDEHNKVIHSSNYHLQLLIVAFLIHRTTHPWQQRKSKHSLGVYYHAVWPRLRLRQEFLLVVFSISSLCSKCCNRVSKSGKTDKQDVCIYTHHHNLSGLVIYIIIIRMNM